VIESFKHKGLRDLWMTGTSAGIRQDLHKRLLVRLDAIQAATDLDQLCQPGFDFHPLRCAPVRYSVHVNGPWCVTFEWDDGNAYRINLEQYH